MNNILTIEELRKGYINNQHTPYEVCSEIIKRAELYKNMNIWIVPPSMELMNAYIDELKDKNIADYPLWGIPFAIKDNIDLENVPTTAGCESYKYIPGKNAYVVEKLINAGAIPVGKTNLDQFATGLVGTRSLYGETHNSIKPELISGGSSSGSAVAVAMGLAAFSLGTDTAGSGRVPAALNNIVGLKPTVGAWSTNGVVPACRSLDCVTVFANTIKDTEIVDSIAKGYDDECPWSKIIKPTEKKLPEKICIPKEPLKFYGKYEDKYRKSWNNAIDKIKKMGIPIEFIDYDVFSEAAAILYDGPWIAERWAALGGFIKNCNMEYMVPVTEKILKSGNKSELKADDVFKAIHRLAEIKCHVRKLLKNSVLVMPTCGGTFTIDDVNASPIETNSLMGLYTNHCNLLDLSAFAFRSGFADDGVPFGLTSFALAENDSINMAFAQYYEDFDKYTLIGVCGLHMRGYPFEPVLKENGGVYLKDAFTAECYSMYKLPMKPERPGLVYDEKNGKCINIEIWKVPVKNLGKFLITIPAPLGLGKIKLYDGSSIVGFICEGYISESAENITDLKSWKNI